MRRCETKTGNLPILSAFLYENSHSAWNWMGTVWSWYCWMQSGAFWHLFQRLDTLRPGSWSPVWLSYCSINFTEKYLFHFGVLVSKYSFGALAITSLTFYMSLTRNWSFVASPGLSRELRREEARRPLSAWGALPQACLCQRPQLSHHVVVVVVLSHGRAFLTHSSQWWHTQDPFTKATVN